MKLKDYFTLGNLLGGYFSVVALLLGSFDWAVWLIYFAYVCDILDGPVARWTKQHDTFGSIFDTISDYITNSIAVSFILFYAFWHNAGWPAWLAAIIGAFPFTFGSLRQVRGMEKDVSYPAYFLGLPRPVLALFVLALLNSSLFTISVQPWDLAGQIAAAVLVVAGSILHLSTFPFPSHHGRRFTGMLRFGKWFFLAGSPISLFGGWILFDAPGLFYDHMLISMLTYIFLAWTGMPRTDWYRIRAYLAGGEKVLPLVHPTTGWRSTRLGEFWWWKDP